MRGKKETKIDRIKNRNRSQ